MSVHTQYITSCDGPRCEFKDVRDVPHIDPDWVLIRKDLHFCSDACMEEWAEENRTGTEGGDDG